MNEDRPRILCVDDEPNVLAALRRHLHRETLVYAETSGRAGLATLRRDPSIAAILSDLRMPEMDGVAFLRQAREAAPDATRMLLTGNADVSAAVAAVNEGCLFRFLMKPCPTDLLLSSVRDAIGQHRLVTSERVLLEQTLHGSVRMLTEALALASPQTFGRARRVKERAGAVAARLGAPARWKVELAAMLAQVAHVTLPQETVDRIRRWEELEPKDRAMLARLPAISERLLAGIPRLDEVREILRHQEHRFAGDPDRAAAPVPVGARILKAVNDLDALESQGTALDVALEAMKSRVGWYDPCVLEVLASLEPELQSPSQVAAVNVDGLRPGMVFMQDVLDASGRLLVAQGQEVWVGLFERLQNFAMSVGVQEPIQVLIRSGAEAEPAPEPAPAR